METHYEISLDMKTLHGIETFGCFSIGHDEDLARRLFASLSADVHVSADSVITIDLLRRENGIPFPLELRHCSYDQLAANVQMITREVFKCIILKNKGDGFWLKKYFVIVLLVKI